MPPRNPLLDEMRGDDQERSGDEKVTEMQQERKCFPTDQEVMEKGGKGLPVRQEVIEKEGIPIKNAETGMVKKKKK